MADEPKAIEKSIKSDPSYTNIFDYVKNMKCEPIVRPNCKMCNSIYRKEAEELYADGKPAHWVYKWLKTKGEDLSAHGVNNHFVEHYNKPIYEQRIKAYAENLQDYSRIKVDEEERLHTYATLLDQQIHTLGSTISRVSSEDMRRGQETLIKLIDQATKVQERIRAMKQENEPIRILVERLNTVMTVKYSEAKTDEAKRAIAEIVDLVVKETEIVTNANK